jgi:hypothetical protein
MNNTEGEAVRETATERAREGVSIMTLIGITGWMGTIGTICTWFLRVLKGQTW